MTETKVKAIVLGGIDYKEKDMLVSLFTLEEGIISAVFKGVKNPNAKLKSAKEMFSFGDFIISENKTKIVISSDIVDSFYEITKDIKKYYIACAIMDTLKTTLPTGEPNPELFLATLKCLNLLAYQNVNIYNVLNKFLTNIFEGVGYKFVLDECNNCGAKFINRRFMNLQYGDITCHNCRVGNTVELTPIIYNTLRLYSKTEYEKLSTLKIKDDANRSVLKLLLFNFEYRFNKKITVML